MSTTIVRYRPMADRADENQSLIEAVFAELKANRPDGLRYASFRLEDGTFVHIAEVEGDTNPLPQTAAFGAFTAEIHDRCEAGEGPNAQGATLVGSYGFGD